MQHTHTCNLASLNSIVCSTSSIPIPSISLSSITHKKKTHSHSLPPVTQLFEEETLKIDICFCCHRCTDTETKCRRLHSPLKHFARASHFLDANNQTLDTSAASFSRSKSKALYNHRSHSSNKAFLHLADKHAKSMST